MDVEIQNTQRFWINVHISTKLLANYGVRLHLYSTDETCGKNTPSLTNNLYKLISSKLIKGTLVWQGKLKYT